MSRDIVDRCLETSLHVDLGSASAGIPAGECGAVLAGVKAGVWRWSSLVGRESPRGW